jgi:hypothetical protein
MEIDPDRIDEAVLALLFLGRHEKVRSLRLGRHGAVACKGAYLGPGWEGKISGLHRAQAIREALSVTGVGVQVNRPTGPEPHPIASPSSEFMDGFGAVRTGADGRPRLPPALLPSRPGPSQ